MRGEACVTHLLEMYEGNEIQQLSAGEGALLVLGTGINQDGRSSSLTVHYVTLRSDALQYTMGDFSINLFMGVSSICTQLVHEAFRHHYEHGGDT